MSLCAEDLSRRLGKKLLFTSVSFTLAHGQTLAVVGESGAGKTSLLRCLAWLDPLSGGVLTLDGEAPQNWGIGRWRSQVCYVPQHPPALRGRARTFSERVMALSRQADRAKASPYELGESWGLDRRLWDEDFALLSGGEKQRIMLALALAHRPRVLLLDEPTASLDTLARSLVEQSLRGQTALWVTHDVEQAKRVGQAKLEL